MLLSGTLEVTTEQASETFDHPTPRIELIQLWSVAIFALAAFLCFAVAFAVIAVALNHAVKVEQQVRAAQNQRATILRLQLDEETGVRGYVDTRDRNFLQPYYGAESRYAAETTLLRMAALRTAPNVVPIVDDEDLTHRRWLKAIAQPLIATSNKGATYGLQLKGKDLIDHFRDDNEAIERTFDDAAQRSDSFVSRLTYAIIGCGLLLGASLLGANFLTVITMIRGHRRRAAKELHVQIALHESERKIADALQDALMPFELPSIRGLALHARYRPADAPERVGGDWYDVFPMPDGRVLFIIGDVVGHGIKAIEFMSRLRRKILTAAMHEADPGAILTEANRQVLQTSTQPILGTALCALVDPDTGWILYATAGHPAPILVQPDEAQLLATGELMLGVQDTKYRTHAAHALRNALLVLYTDGLLEFTRDAVAGEAELLTAARDVAWANADNPALAIKQTILAGAAPQDDVAILTITFTRAEARGSPEETGLRTKETGEIVAFPSSPSEGAQLKAVMPKLKNQTKRSRRAA